MPFCCSSRGHLGRCVLPAENGFAGSMIGMLMESFI